VLAQKDGQPALGWLSAVRRERDRLVGDFTDVPIELQAAINAGLYKQVSVELYPEFAKTEAEKNLGTGRTGPVLAAVAFLGADLPRVKGLADLPRIAASEDEPTLQRIDFTTEPRPTLVAGARAHPHREAPMPDDTKPEKAKQSEKSAADILALSEKLAAEKAERATERAAQGAEIVKLSEARAAMVAETAALKETVARLSEARAAMEQRNREMEADRFVAEFSNAENLRVLPAERAFVKAAYLRLSASPDGLVVLSEGKEETLAGEAFLRAWLSHRPDKKALLTTMSEATKPAAAFSTLDMVLERIATERKLDTSKPTWKRDATIIACTEDPYKTEYATLVAGPGPRTTH